MPCQQGTCGGTACFGSHDPLNGCQTEGGACSECGLGVLLPIAILSGTSLWDATGTTPISEATVFKPGIWLTEGPTIPPGLMLGDFLIQVNGEKATMAMLDTWTSSPGPFICLIGRLVAPGQIEYLTVTVS